MKKIFIFILLVTVFLAFAASAVATEEFIDDIPKDSHKIKNKWDLAGTFLDHASYRWGEINQHTWTYNIHIKEAMYGEYSKGSIHFSTILESGEVVDVVGHVDATKRLYQYWSGDNIAAVGTAVYNDTHYYFMFLHAERAMWFALSTTPYDTYWAIDSVWGGGLREYQLHSNNATSAFTLDYKVIHE